MLRPGGIAAGGGCGELQLHALRSGPRQASKTLKRGRLAASDSQSLVARRDSSRRLFHPFHPPRLCGDPPRYTFLRKTEIDHLWVGVLGLGSPRVIASSMFFF